MGEKEGNIAKNQDHVENVFKCSRCDAARIMFIIGSRKQTSEVRIIDTD